MRARRGFVIAALTATLVVAVPAGDAYTWQGTTPSWAIVIPHVNSDNWIVRYDLVTSRHPDSPRTFVRLKVRADSNSFHAWSPDGAKVALEYPTSRKDAYEGKFGLYVAAVPGGSGRVVARVFDTDSPVWSPDSSRLAFSRSSGLYVVSLNGRPARRFSTLTGGPMSWAPDGKSVICYCGGKLRVIEINGSGQRLLAVHSLKIGVAVAWSPSGRYVAYQYDCGLHGLREAGDAYCRVGFASPTGATTTQPHPSVCTGSGHESLWTSDDTLLVTPWGCSPGGGFLFRVNPRDGSDKPALKSYEGGPLATGPSGTFAFLDGAVNKPNSTLVIVDRHGHVLKRQSLPIDAFGGSSITLNY